MSNGYYSIILTEQCNMSCAHCCQMSGPLAKRRLTVNEAKSFIDFIATKKPKFLGVSGGEVFLLRDDFKEVVKHAKKSLIPIIGCVSNAYWAGTYDNAYSLLSEFREAGLNALAISIDDFHMPFINIGKIKNAVRASVELGIFTRLHVVVTKSSRDLNHYLSELGDLAKHLNSSEEIKAVPSGRARLEIPTDDFIYETGIPVGKCPSETFTLIPKGKIYYCCSAFGTFDNQVDPLKIGELEDLTYEELMDYSTSAPIYKVLREIGPSAFIPAIKSAGSDHKLSGKYVNVCHLCTEILSDTQMRNIAVDDASRILQYEKKC